MEAIAAPYTREEWLKQKCAFLNEAALAVIYDRQDAVQMCRDGQYVVRLRDGTTASVPFNFIVLPFADKKIREKFPVNETITRIGIRFPKSLISPQYTHPDSRRLTNRVMSRWRHLIWGPDLMSRHRVYRQGHRGRRNIRVISSRPDADATTEILVGPKYITITLGLEKPL